MQQSAVTALAAWAISVAAAAPAMPSGKCMMSSQSKKMFSKSPSIITSMAARFCPAPRKRGFSPLLNTCAVQNRHTRRR